MTVCLLLLGDGRHDYRDRTIASAKEMLPTLDHLVEIDDSDHQLGFGGAIAEGWRQVVQIDATYVFHLELDFTFNAPIPVARIVSVLDRHSYLVQIALKRQPWNDQEKAAGGIIEMHPEDYRQRVEHGDVWTEHRRNFTTNPCIYPAALCHRGWPREAESEGKFGLRLVEDPDARFAYWGGKFDPPLVEHIGVERTGNGY